MTTEVEYRTRCDLCGEYTKQYRYVTVDMPSPHINPPMPLDVCGPCAQRPIADLLAKAE